MESGTEFQQPCNLIFLVVSVEILVHSKIPSVSKWLISHRGIQRHIGLSPFRITQNNPSAMRRYFGHIASYYGYCLYIHVSSP